MMANAQTCYYPDGSVASNDSPCRSSSVGEGPSACCDPADICLNNGLCLAQWGGEVISRGSCTDRSWQSPACSQYCADGKSFTQRFGNLFNRRFRCRLILTLILIFKTIPGVERPSISLITTRTNRRFVVARVSQTTTHARNPIMGAPQRFSLKLGW